MIIVILIMIMILIRKVRKPGDIGDYVSSQLTFPSLFPALLSYFH